MTIRHILPLAAFAAASAFWLAAMFVTAYLLLKERDVKA